MRNVYGSSFYLISVFSHYDKRKQKLCELISSTRNIKINQTYNTAQELIVRDESEETSQPYGQNVRETFPKADFFIKITDDQKDDQNITNAMKRFISLIFNDEFYTPSEDEFAMFNAYASSKNSGSLSRQVGASILNNEGKIVSSGTNELPKVGGGILTTKSFERRIFNHEIDPSDTRKKNLFVDLMHILNNLNLLNQEYNSNQIQQLLEKYQTELKAAQITNIIEFFREIHAEMDAIIAAARSNNNTINCSLFTTTYPCHDCTKHIIAAGIRRVIFVEPYPKSLATELYDEFISIEGVNNPEKKVKFESYVGIAPRLFMNIFTMSKRKEKNGEIVKWNGSVAKLKHSEQFQYYYLREIVAIGKISKYIPIDLQ